MPRLPWFFATAALLVSACGGSSSETPFPEAPLPDYMKPANVTATATPATTVAAPTTATAPAEASGAGGAPSAEPASD